MRATLMILAFASWLLAAPGALAGPKPQAEPCPQIDRKPVARLAQLPSLLRKQLGHMAEVDGRWNVGDAIGPGETHLPFRHFLAGGDMGDGRWLVIWEQGGFARFANVEVYRLTRRRTGLTADKVISRSGGDLPGLCRLVADQLRAR